MQAKQQSLYLAPTPPTTRASCDPRLSYLSNHPYLRCRPPASPPPVFPISPSIEIQIRHAESGVFFALTRYYKYDVIASCSKYTCDFLSKANESQDTRFIAESQVE